MICPIDNHSLFSHRTRSGLDVDLCPACKGVWFDEGEFRVAIQTYSGFSLPEKYQLANIDEANDVALRDDDTKVDKKTNPLYKRALICPRDGSQMKTFHYDGNSKIFLDRCNICHGIWLDHGEIEWVKRHLKDPTMDALARAFSAHFREEEKMHEDLRKLPLLPYLLFAPAFFVPVRENPRSQFLPPLTTTLILLLLVLLWFVGPHTVDILLSAAAAVLFLWLFGGDTEERLTAPYFTLLLALSGILGSVALAVSGVWADDPGFFIGVASAVSGTLGAYIVLFPGKKIVLLREGARFTVPAWFYIGSWAFIQSLGLNFGEVSMGENFTSHLVGFATGMFFAICVMWREYAVMGTERKSNVSRARRIVPIILWLILISLLALKIF